MISLITPAYNGERFIEACVQVVVEKQCSDVEYIIKDNCEDDCSV